MKHPILVLVLITLAVLIALPVETVAQAPPNVTTLCAAKSYANAQKDTLKVLRIGGSHAVSVWFYAKDSVNVQRKVQYCKSSGVYADANWTTVKTDTINATTATYSELVLRPAATDLVGGVYGWTRVIYTFLASDNGVTTPTYDCRVSY